MEKIPEPQHYDVPPPYSSTASAPLPPAGTMYNSGLPSDKHDIFQNSSQFQYQTPQPQPGYYSQPQQQQSQPQPVQQQVIVQVVQPPNLHSFSSRIICQYCHADIKTRIKKKNNMVTHMCAIILCIFCCPIFWIPYCGDCCKDTVHECPNCDRFLGEYRMAERRRY